MKPIKDPNKYSSLAESVVDISPQRVHCKICEENNLNHKAQLSKTVLIILVGVVIIAAIILLEQRVLLKDHFRDTDLLVTNTSLSTNDSSVRKL